MLPTYKKIYIAILNQGWIRTELVMRLLEWTKAFKYQIFVNFPAEKPIANNRNKIVQRFLKTDCDFLMMLDSDIVPPEDILNLADFDKDIIGGLCFARKKDGIIPLVLEYKPKENPEKPYKIMNVSGIEGLIECDAIGTGCILIKREVLEHPKMKAPFLDQFDENGIRKEGLDLYFCRKAKEAGFKVYCHLDYPCSHWTYMDLKEIYESLNQRSEIIKKLLKK